MHNHTALECNLIIRGTARYIIDGDICHIKAGDCIWLHPAQAHQLLDPSSDLDAWVIVADAHLIADLATRIPEGQLLTRPRRSLTEVIRRLSSSSLQRCHGLLRDVATVAIDDPGSADAALEWVIARLWHASRSADHPGHLNLHPAVVEAQRLLADVTIPLDHLAQAVGLSRPHLSRLFAQQTGQTLTAYRNHIRLGNALRLLQDSTLGTLDIAYEAGFGSYPQFHRIFLATMGAAPGQWRLRQQGRERTRSE
jgi:AraC-like DNA-binding protein